MLRLSAQLLLATISTVRASPASTADVSTSHIHRLWLQRGTPARDSNLTGLAGTPVVALLDPGRCGGFRHPAARFIANRCEGNPVPRSVSVVQPLSAWASICRPVRPFVDITPVTLPAPAPSVLGSIPDLCRRPPCAHQKPHQRPHQ